MQGGPNKQRKVLCLNFSYLARKYELYFMSPNDSGINFDLPSQLLKEFKQRACSWTKVITRDISKEYKPSVVAGTPRDQSPLRVPLSLQAQQTFIYQTSAFPSPSESRSSLLKSQTTTPNSLFCLWLQMVFKVRAWAILVTQFPWISHIYMLCSFCLTFSCLTASCSLILGPVRASGRMEKFLPAQQNKVEGIRAVWRLLFGIRNRGGPPAD